MPSALRMLWDELKGKMPPLGYIIYTLERMLSSTSTDLQHETEHILPNWATTNCFVWRHQLVDTVIRTKTVLHFYQ